MPPITDPSDVGLGSVGRAATPVQVMRSTGLSVDVLGATALLAFSDGAALFLCIAGLVLLGVGHTEHVEFGLYLTTYLLLVPLAVALARTQRGRLERRSAELVERVAAAQLLAILAVIVAARLLWVADPDPRALWAFVEVSLAVGAGAVWLYMSRSSTGLASAAKSRLAHRVAVWLLLTGGLACFLPGSGRSAVRIGEIVIVAALATWLLSCPLGRVSRRGRVLVDVCAAAVILLLVPIVVFVPSGAVPFNHNFFLGPANSVLHGKAVLVDVFSQYGVGLVYAIAGMLRGPGIGYGTFTLLLGALNTAQFLCVYAVLRLAIRSQLLAVLGTGIAIAANVFTQAPGYLYVYYPSTTALRFGLPVAIVLLSVLGAAYPARRRPSRVAALVLTGVASLWSFETFAYSAGAYAGIVLVAVWTPDQRPGRALVREFAWALLAVVTAQVFLAVGTRIAAGGWPDWPRYLAYVRLYSASGFGTLPIAPWSPGLLLGAIYFLSAIGLTVLVLQPVPARTSSPQALLALAGATGFGILSFTYFLGRSHPNNLHHVVVPAVIVVIIWLGFGRDTGVLAPAASRLVVVGSAGVAAAIVVLGLPGIRWVWPQTALGVMVDGGPVQGPRDLDTDLRTLASSPVVDERAAEAARLIEGSVAGGRPALVLLQGEATPEALMRSGRINLLPTTDPTQDDVLPDAVARVLAAVPELRPGTLLITDMFGRPVRPQPPGSATVDVVAEAYLQIKRLFVLDLVRRAAAGVSLVRLERRAGDRVR